VEIGSGTVITISVRAALWGAGVLGAALVGGTWLLTTFVLGEVKDDIHTIREDVAAVRLATDERVTTLVSSDGDLSKSISDLVAQLTVNNSELRSLNESITRIDDRLLASIQRQEEFERYVVTRLPSPTSLPALWQQNQKEIISTISALGVDPLASWYKSTATEQ